MSALSELLRRAAKRSEEQTCLRTVEHSAQPFDWRYSQARKSWFPLLVWQSQNHRHRGVAAQPGPSATRGAQYGLCMLTRTTGTRTVATRLHVNGHARYSVVPMRAEIK